MRDGDFRIRGKDISRVEGLSDAVFGFAITLLIVSLEVPKTAEEVLHAMRGFFAFAFTFSLLFSVWRTQFKFFRRYGLEDNRTVLLNAVLLFTILFFVYPLKFMFTMITERVLARAGFPDPAYHVSLSGGMTPVLQMTYGIGWAAVFGVFGLLYRHALSKREELNLNAVEIFDTEEAIVSAGLASIAGLIVAVTNLLTYLMKPIEEQIAYASLAVVAVLFIFIARRRRGRRARRAHLVREHASQ